LPVIPCSLTALISPKLNQPENTKVILFPDGILAKKDSYLDIS
jgi:hypothetical protein